MRLFLKLLFLLVYVFSANGVIINVNTDTDNVADPVIFPLPGVGGSFRSVIKGINNDISLGAFGAGFPYTINFAIIPPPIAPWTISLAGALSMDQPTDNFITFNVAAGDVTIGGAALQDGIGTGTGIIKTGTNTLTLSAANTYSGGTQINAGTVSISANNNLGAVGGAVTFNTGGTLRYTASVASLRTMTFNAGGGILDVANNLDIVTLSGNLLPGTGGSLTKDGTGTLQITGATKTYMGGTIVNDGTLQIGSNNALPTAGALTMVGGTFDLDTFNQTIGNLSGTVGTISLGSQTLTVTSATSTTYSGVLTGGVAANFVKNGPGTLTLGGDNITYNGMITLQAGTIAVAHNNALGNVFGADDFIFNGVGTILQFANTYTVPTQITLTTDGIVDTNTFDGTLSGTIGDGGGANSLTKTGAGILTLSGGNNYGGGTSLDNGTINVMNNNSLGIGPLTFNGANTILEFGGTHTLPNDITLTLAGIINTPTGNNGTLSGIISGGAANSLTKTGPAILTLTAANTYSGGTFINGGTLSIDDDARLGDVNGGVTFNSGTLQYTTTTTSPATRTMTIGVTGGTIEVVGGAVTATVDGDIIGGAVLADAPNYVLTKDGDGTLIISSDNNAELWSTIIDDGTLQLSAADNRLPTAGNVTVNSTGIFALNKFNQTIGSLSGTAGASVTLGDGTPGSTTLTINTTSSTIYAGIINDGDPGSGAGLLVKQGTGTQTLSGANTYTGGTTINAGTIIAGHNNALGTGALTFDDLGTASNNPTLQFAAGPYNLSNTITLTTGGIVNTPILINGTLSGVISGPSALTKTGEGTLSLTAANTYSGGTTINQGLLNITADDRLGDPNGTITFTGASHTSYGSLQWGGAFSLAGTRALVFTGHGGLDIQNFPVTLAAAINMTGPGMFYKLGSATLTLSRANQIANTLGVSVMAGTLDFANFQQNIGSLSGKGLSSAKIKIGDKTLTINQTVKGTYNGIIEGTGGLIKTGNALLTLNGRSTFSGNTEIRGGTLALAAGGGTTLNPNTDVSIGANATLDVEQAQTLLGVKGQGRVINSAPLTLNPPDGAEYDLSGGIFGGGKIIKRGLGTQIIRANLTGLLEVHQGTFVMRGGSLGDELSDLVTVYSGGKFLSQGTINATVNVERGGTFGGGRSATDLTIIGNVTFQENSNLYITVSSSAATFLDIDGKLIVKPGVKVIVKENNVTSAGPTVTYPILKTSQIFDATNMYNMGVITEGDAAAYIYNLVVYEQSNEVRLNGVRVTATIGQESSLEGTGPLYFGKQSHENLQDYVAYITREGRLTPELGRLIIALNEKSQEEQEEFYKTLDVRVYPSTRELSFNRGNEISNQIMAHQNYIQTFPAGNNLGESSFIPLVDSRSFSKEDERTMFQRLWGFDGHQAYEDSLHHSIAARSPLSAASMFTKVLAPTISSGQKGGQRQLNFGAALNSLVPYYGEHEQYSFWLQPFGFINRKGYEQKESELDKSKKRQADDLRVTNNGGGLILGLERKLNSYMIGGLCASLTATTLDWTNQSESNSGKGHLRNYGLSFYGSVFYKNLVIDWTLSGGKTNYNTTRSINFGGGDKFNSTQSHGAFSSWGDIKFGYQTRFNKGTFQPYVQVSYMVEKENPYREYGNQGLAMYIAGQTFQMMKYEGGALVSKVLAWVGGMFSVFGKLSYSYKMPTTRAQYVIAGFREQPGQYASHAIPMKRHFGNIGLGLMGKGGLLENFSVNVNLEAVSRHDYKVDLFFKGSLKF